MQAQDRAAIYARTLDRQALHLIILPTEKCNFRCTYCYEDFLIGNMKRELIDGIKNLLMARVEDVSAFSISWFGGEPLLTLNSIIEINHHCMNLIVDKPGASFTSDITTNGFLLTEDVFLKLIAAQVQSFQITLDGPAPIHDLTRIRKDRSGTFEVIWRNLLSIASHAHSDESWNVTLRLHYDAETIDHLEPLVDDICSKLIPTGRFNVHFHSIEKLGGANDGAIKSATKEHHQRAKGLRDKIARVTESESTSLAAAIENYVCYAAKANSLLIRADGRIGKCTVALSDPRNDIGQLHPDGTLALKGDRIAPWLRGIASGNKSELACPLRSLPALVS